jgi:hypothetical protein
MRPLRTLLGLGLWLVSLVSHAEADVFALGNGQHGPLRVQRMDTSVNLATALTTTATAGSTTLGVADVAGFAAGELVLVLQMTASALPAEGSTGPLELNPTGAGRWEFARLEAVGNGALRLTAPLVNTFPGPGSQVVRVPEYTSVHVQPASSLLAPPWNGSSGGVLVFLATDFVLNQGIISAEGAGFRGGTFKTSTGRPTGCAEPHQSEATGGAHKGEGLFSTVAGAPTHGYGALGNGAGGGNCDDGGGGGGGHGGAGGQGGFTVSSDGARDVGGRGGVALRYSGLTRLMLGGGGGAGAGGTTGQGGGSSGGAGGGIIYIRARDFQGSQGRVLANGQSAAAASADGAGGGGAGGHITVRSEGRVDCTGFEANGGNGGDSTDNLAHGPGGGGGGGVILVQGSPLSCASSTLPGVAGKLTGAGGGTHGATPTATTQPEGQGSTTTLDEGFAPPAVPAWVQPAEGASTGPRPKLEGTAQPGSVVQVFLDGKLLGNVEATASGSFTFLLTQDLPLGAHQVSAYAERFGLRGSPSEPRAFTVGTLEPVELAVGCGCGAGAGGGWLALGVVLPGMARRARGAARQAGARG